MELAPQILIVDDDREIRNLLADYLESNALRTLSAADGVSMRKILETSQPDLIILDINMPGTDGLTLCRELRAHSKLPIIMLTARGEAVDRIVGLEMGADDYLTKPFEPRELLARIRSVLRRTEALPPNLEQAPADKYVFANWQLDVTARQLVDDAGVVVSLSSAEFRLLKAFVEYPNRPLSRDQILSLTSGRDIEPFDRSVDIQVSRLRQKLGDEARAPQLIKTVRNEGYMLAVPVRIEASA